MTQPAFLDGRRPVLAAPMAGASTPALAAAVSESGGVGFLAAGYQSAEALSAEIAAYRAATSAPVAVNLFTPQLDRTAELEGRLRAYAEELAEDAAILGTRLGAATYDDDEFDAKIATLLDDPVDAVTFTFGPVAERVVADLRSVGTSVGFTVTGASEARSAVGCGADFLVAQGADAGGHRGTWQVSDQPNSDPALVVTRQVTAAGLPVIAAGGVADAGDVRALLEAGAVAVSVGTRFVAAHESGSPRAHKDALTSPRYTEAVVTRAFTGRPARGLANAFTRRHDGRAPSAYPNVHRLTRPLRRAAAAADDADHLALWAGSGHSAAHPAPAASILRSLLP